MMLEINIQVESRGMLVWLLEIIQQNMHLIKGLHFQGVHSMTYILILRIGLYLDYLNTVNFFGLKWASTALKYIYKI